MKCSECGSQIEETFLRKIVGTYVKKNGKKVAICGQCQAKRSTAA